MAHTVASAFLICFAVQCIATGTHAQRNLPVRCVPGKAQFPNPNDRYSFYKCDAGGNPILFQCPPGTWFNPRLEVCDWDTGNNDQQNGGGNSANNDGGWSSQNQSPDFATGGNWWKPPATSTNTVRPSTNQGTNNSNQPGNEVRPTPNGWCDSRGPLFYQNTEDCSSFFTCSKGRFNISYCPRQMYYNPQTYRCERTVPRGCSLIENTGQGARPVEESSNDDVWQYARFG